MGKFGLTDKDIIISDKIVDELPTLSEQVQQMLNMTQEYFSDKLNYTQIRINGKLIENIQQHIPKEQQLEYVKFVAGETNGVISKLVPSLQSLKFFVDNMFDLKPIWVKQIVIKDLYSIFYSINLIDYLIHNPYKIENPPEKKFKDSWKWFYKEFKKEAIESQHQGNINFIENCKLSIESFIELRNIVEHSLSKNSDFDKNSLMDTTIPNWNKAGAIKILGIDNDKDYNLVVMMYGYFNTNKNFIYCEEPTPIKLFGFNGMVDHLINFYYAWCQHLFHNIIIYPTKINKKNKVKK